MIFTDRIEAGQRLASALAKYKGARNAVVLAIPRGGVVLGYIVSKELGLPLEIELVKKIEHPLSPELAIGAVSMTGRIINNGHGATSRNYIEAETLRIRELLTARYKKYSRNPVNWHGKVVIIVDDGIATGSTVFAMIDLLKKDMPEKIVIATPVGPRHTIQSLRGLADEVISLETPEDFFAISEFYEDFEQVSDEEVMQMLKESEQVKHAHHNE